ncbi:MAG: heavy metal translocating P-type ATPase [Oscillospiraceae bacterium]
MNKRQKKILARIILGIAMLAPALLLSLTPALKLCFFAAAYLVTGFDILLGAVRNIFRGQIFDENFLMSLATVGAFAIGEYSEGVAVMIFFQVGELFQSLAVERSRRSIAALMDIRPDKASLELDGVVTSVDPDSVNIGDVIVVKPGERIPLDGIVVDGSSSIDTASLTGEAMPRNATSGDEVMSGCINLRGVLRIRVSRVFSESTVAQILDLVENASIKKAKTENFITRFARIYTPCVVAAALLLASVPPLFFGGAWSEWIHRALSFLVISCPCALVISIPLGFFGGIGGASKRGILIKGGTFLESLAQTEIAVFDKTGTLTKGSFEVVGTHIEENAIAGDDLLALAAAVEAYSDHPIAESLRRAVLDFDKLAVTNTEEISGHGITATLDGETIAVGNERLMDTLGISRTAAAPETGTIVHVARGGKYLGYIVISDEIKPDSARAISELRSCGVKKTVMLTGDSKSAASSAAAALGVDEYRSNLLPADKVKCVEELMGEKTGRGKLIFVGDGINDAPVLMRADLGVSMGGLGSDAAIEASDVVLMDDNVLKLVEAIKIARRTLLIVRENICFALGIKFAVLILGAFGIAGMWEAVFADVGVSVLAILNAMRALNPKIKQ